ncbi:MAG: methyl-accepting chemotaxis protein [Pseudomonadota bacterium]
MFANVSLRNELYLGFGLAVLMVGLIAGYAVWSGFNNAAQFANYRSAALATATSTRAGVDAMHMRFETKRFRSGLIEDPTTAVQQDIASMRSYQADMAEQGLPEAESFADALRFVDFYTDAVQRAQTLEMERMELIDTVLNPLGTEIRQKLSSLLDSAQVGRNWTEATNASRAVQQLLLARAYAGRYIASSNPDYSARVFAELDQLNNAVPQLARSTSDAGRRGIAEGVITDLDRYRQTFIAITEAQAARDEIYRTELDQIGDAIVDQVLLVADSSRERQNALGPDITAAFHQQKLISVAAGAFGILIAGIFGFMLARSISSPILLITNVMDRLRDHDLSVEVPETHRGDEIGTMARAVDVFKQSMIEADALKAEQDAEQAQRRQRQDAVEAAIGEFESKATAALMSVVCAAEQMEDSSKNLTSMAEEAKSQSATVADASEEASQNVQTVAGAAEQLSASIAEIGQQVDHSAQMSREAVADAENTSVEVRSLADTAEKIGEVVGLIKDIAEQTNLLALNATIEAARAGDAGKGFAVVATEVKALAEQTAKATEQIGGQVGAIQDATNMSVAAIQTITEKISSMDEVASAIAAAVEEQGSATQDIARSVQQVAVGTDEVSRNITGVSSAAVETGSASAQVLTSSQTVNSEAANMRLHIETFLDRIRAA